MPRDDIFLTLDGDINITNVGDISLTTSIRQAIIIRLKWFFNEWRFIPQYGIPYFEDILVKNPNTVKIKSIIRKEIMTVDGVIEVRNVDIKIDNKRNAVLTFEAVSTEEIIKEEIIIYADIA